MPFNVRLVAQVLWDSLLVLLGQVAVRGAFGMSGFAEYRCGLSLAGD
ncbi:MAG: hypothetical protein KDA90_15210 [Planctomycetaceae bacterium]|nr:hypothetical protein [Planctomycetaceae bacterium]